MVHFEPWKIVTILVVVVLALLYAVPNVLPGGWSAGMQATLPSWMPGKTVNLGLDLRGGVHQLYRADVDAVVQERLDAYVDDLRRALRGDEVGYVGLDVLPGEAVVFTLRDAADRDRARRIARDVADEGMTVTIGDGLQVRLEPTEAYRRILTDNILEATIEVVRRRIDPTGTTEPVITRQGEDRVLVQIPGAESIGPIDPVKMNFHLVDEDADINAAVEGRVPPGSMLLPHQEGTMLVVERRIRVSGDHLVDAQATFQQGQPIIAFRFDGAGARRFANTTRENVDRRLAVVLDGVVISAPVIRSPILGGRGIIEGGFTVESANQLAQDLRAGALPAPLTVLETRTVGPSLGADSIEAGKAASAVGLTLVVVFMVIAYGRFGLFAASALLFNVVFLFALLSLLQASLTLPGIAGIVLTIGMAVDANVLIFERIREEVRQGRSPISAVDAGYAQAMRTIIDSNLTTLIAAVLLYAFGSGPVRGFAVTLGFGIATSFFSAIYVTRLMLVLWLRRTRPKELPL